MKRYSTSIMLAALAAVFLISANPVAAQGVPQARNGNNGTGRAGRDPAQVEAQRLDRYRQLFEVDSADEWKVISAAIQKVQKAQREARVTRFGRGLGFGANGRNRGNNARTRTNAPAQGNANDTTQTNPDVTALQAAVDAKAPEAEIRGRVAKLRETMKVKQANLLQAQGELRQILTVRQEAIATVAGLL